MFISHLRAKCFVREHWNIIEFSIHFRDWEGVGTGTWNYFQWKQKTCLSRIVNANAADDLATQTTLDSVAYGVDLVLNVIASALKSKTLLQWIIII